MAKVRSSQALRCQYGKRVSHIDPPTSFESHNAEENLPRREQSTGRQTGETYRLQEGQDRCRKKARSHHASHVVRWNRFPMEQYGDQRIRTTRIRKRGYHVPAGTMAKVRSSQPLRCQYGKRVSHIDPPTSLKAIMRRKTYREENSEPGRCKIEPLD